MIPPTGYTPAISKRERLRNEIRACIHNHRAAQSVDGPNMDTYWRNRTAAAIQKYREYKAAEKRADVEKKIMRCYNSLTGEQVADGGTLAKLYDELAALTPAPAAAPSFDEEFETLTKRRSFIENELAREDCTPRAERELMDELLEIDKTLAPFEKTGDDRAEWAMRQRRGEVL